MEKCGFVLPAGIDRLRLQQTSKNRRKFSDILITGFDSAHWADWFLLRATVELAENATVVLQEPRDLSDIDLCWIGSWEEIGGEAKRPTKTAPVAGANDSLFSEAEMRGDAQLATRFDFLVGLNFSEQAEAIARHCLKYLAEENCARVGRDFSRRECIAASGYERAGATRHSAQRQHRTHRSRHFRDGGMAGLD